MALVDTRLRHWRVSDLHVFKMFARKRQRSLTAFVDIDSSDTDSVPSSSYSSNTNEEVKNESSYSRAQRKFLPCWKYLFPW